MKKRIFFLLLLTIGIFSNGCHEDHDHDHDKEHFSPDGLVLLRDTAIVLEYFQGVVKDTLFAPLNNYTPYYTVKFYDKDKKIINPPADEYQNFTWNISDNSLAEIEKKEGEKYIIRIKGKSIGKTTVKFYIMHGSHADFQTKDIPLVVK